MRVLQLLALNYFWIFFFFNYKGKYHGDNFQLYVCGGRIFGKFNTLENKSDYLLESSFMECSSIILFSVQYPVLKLRLSLKIIEVNEKGILKCLTLPLTQQYL